MSLWAIYIFPRSVHIFSCSRLGRPIAGIYKLPTDTWMWKLGLMPHNSFSGNICFEFSVLCLCSAWPQDRLKLQLLLTDTELKVKVAWYFFLFRCDGQCGAWTGPCTLLTQQQGHSVYRGDSLGTVSRDFLYQVFTLIISIIHLSSRFHWLLKKRVQNFLFQVVTEDPEILVYVFFVERISIVILTTFLIFMYSVKNIRQKNKKR